MICFARTEVPVVAIEQSEPIATDIPVVSLTERATDKLREIIAKQDRTGLALRVYVTPGGCSGFSYGLTFADGTEEDDTTVEMQRLRVVIPPMRPTYIKGTELDCGD